MKILLNIISLVVFTMLFTGSTAQANWKDSFVEDYAKVGLNNAVIKSLAEGISPEEIIIHGMSIKDMDGEKLTAAVCDAGIAVQEMQTSLAILKITQETAIAICEDISVTNKFPGSSYSSASKRTNYDGSGNIVPPPPPPPIPPSPRPASGNNFN